jgi:hypothetical protein
VSDPLPLTTGQVAEFSGAEPWQIRRVIDSLPTPIQRIGQNRIIERSQLPAILGELERRGWLPKGKEADHV